MAYVDELNPIRKIAKRDEDEFKKILETLNLTENKDNQFTDKYEIYLENKKISGYIFDSILSKQNKINSNLHLVKKYFEFVFVDTQNNIYFFEFKEFRCGVWEPEKIENFLRKVYDTHGTNFNLIFDLELYKKNITAINQDILKKLKELSDMLYLKKNNIKKNLLIGNILKYILKENSNNLYLDLDILTDKYSGYILEKILTY